MNEISVIMGVYNPDTSMLTAAVESVLAQTLPPSEFIICDDGSQNYTREFLLEWAEREPRLKIICHEQNKGLAAALNSCIGVASGRYIARQDADDISKPERFANQVAFLSSHPDFAAVGSAIALYDDNGVWATRYFPLYPIKKDFLFTIPFMHGALMFRADTLRRYAYIVAKTTRRAEDYELMMRMYANGEKAANLPVTLYAYREDEASIYRRKFRYRLDDAVVRYQGFKRLGMLPCALPYVLKPVLVGLIPRKVLFRLKKRRYQY